jgi:hypothetical protein
MVFELVRKRAIVPLDTRDEWPKGCNQFNTE